MTRRQRSSPAPDARRPAMRRSSLSFGGLAVVLLILSITWWGRDSATVSTPVTSATPPVQASRAVDSNAAAPTAATPTPPATPTTQAEQLRPTTAAAVVSQSGLPLITDADLPPEALDTIKLIAAGGPFPFDRDGAVFQNRERLLPARRSGYYREYTVITPGENDRGARRIVAGTEGELYYTTDHYASFWEVAP